jgi:hypothetical protein
MTSFGAYLPTYRLCKRSRDPPLKDTSHGQFAPERFAIDPKVATGTSKKGLRKRVPQCLETHLRHEC